MAQDRPSWRDIDKRREQSGGRRKKRDGRNDRSLLPGQSSRYNQYKADLDRLFDQGLAGELLKKTGKEAKAEEEAKTSTKAKSKTKAKTTRAKSGRIPKDTSKATNRLKLIRAVADAPDSQAAVEALDLLVASFGLPDDWDVLGRVLEHHDEKLVTQAVEKMLALLPKTAKVPRRFTLKERLRTIGQTAQLGSLRELAASLEEKL